ncbi:MAG: septum formation initiator family protein [Candidatus Margulisbacteria bacterium]|nr:septum formation initiator family protein [Candidatus Margulisiibacteriota bacterium]
MIFKFRRAVLVLIVLVLLAVIHLFINTQNISLKYEVTDLKIRLSEIRSQRQQLGAQVAEKENLALIEKTAREKLGMTEPAEINYIMNGSAKSSKETNP